jgi:predicted deacylase
MTAPNNTGESPYPVELTAPDISPYRKGNTGIDYITSFDSGRAGPHVMIAAIVHGNELCGPLTLDFLFRSGVRPRQGRLSLAFMNVAAFETFDPAKPESSRYLDEDFNRVWGEDVLDGSRDTVELRRARQVRPIVDTVDYLLDLHSMQHPTVPLALCGPTAKGRAFARRLGYPEHVMADQGHAAGRRLRDYGGFADEASPRNAVLIECGQHWAASSEKVAREAAVRFLRMLDVIATEDVQRLLPGAAPPPAQKVIEVTAPVTIKTDRFRFADAYLGMEVIAKAGTLIGWDGDEEIRTPYDQCVMVMPSRRFRPGTTAVRFGRYV